VPRIAERDIAIAFDRYEGLWKVWLEDDREEHLAPDLREALAEAVDRDPDEPWLVALADQVEDELRHRRYRDGHRQAEAEIHHQAG
jgi:hypothetical protein